MREQGALVAACKLLVAAANAHEAQEELQRAGLLAEDTAAMATIQSGDLVTIARNALYRLLVNDGWTAPGQVTRDMSRDARLLTEETGAVGG